MAEIFGLDLQSLIAEGINAAGGLPPGTLYRKGARTRDAANPSQLSAIAETPYQLQAVVERRQYRREGSAITETRLVMTIIGGSLVPLTVPEAGDRVEVDGGSYVLEELLRSDPAGAAYEFRVR